MQVILDCLPTIIFAIVSFFAGIAIYDLMNIL